jgi:hypothetical protein
MLDFKYSGSQLSEGVLRSQAERYILPVNLIKRQPSSLHIEGPNERKPDQVKDCEDDVESPFDSLDTCF